MKTKQEEIFLQGSPICRGIAIGKPFIFKFVEDNVPEFTISPEDAEGEIHDFTELSSKLREM